jgi:hypothetical protein
MNLPLILHTMVAAVVAVLTIVVLYKRIRKNRHLVSATTNIQCNSLATTNIQCNSLASGSVASGSAAGGLQSDSVPEASGLQPATLNSTSQITKVPAPKTPSTRSQFKGCRAILLINFANFIYATSFVVHMIKNANLSQESEGRAEIEAVCFDLFGLTVVMGAMISAFNPVVIIWCNKKLRRKLLCCSRRGAEGGRQSHGPST